MPQLHYFEREIYEQWGVEPVGHPWLKSVRRTPDSFEAQARNAAAAADFLSLPANRVVELGSKVEI